LIDYSQLPAKLVVNFGDPGRD